MCSKGKTLGYRKVKSLLNNYPSAVYNSLLGYAKTNKKVVVLENHCIVMRKDYGSMQGKVKIIGGGGAGIEPAEVHYVGKGMLAAAVVGEMFTAPSAHEVLVAIRELAMDDAEGILLLVKNYAGDKLNFGLALDRALKEEINVKMLVIGDGITTSPADKRGRRGLAGSVLVYKIAGEMAEKGKHLDEILEECRDNILTDLATVSVTLSPCNNMICDRWTQEIDFDEMILGVGAYGQRGVKKIKISGLTDAVSVAIKEILESSKDFEHDQASVVVLVNNLGATSKLEEGVITLEVTNQLNEQNIKVASVFAGTFMSSLSSQGFSITLLKIKTADTLKYLEAPTTAPAWPKPQVTEGVHMNEPEQSGTFEEICNHHELDARRYKDIKFCCNFSEKAVAALKQITLFAAEALISCERQLNVIDAEVGDGDAGTMLMKGAEAIKKAILTDALEFTTPGKFFYDVSDLCCNNMGGLSGGLYTVFFSAAGKVFQKAEEITPEVCSAAFRSAVKAMKHYGGAELGDRTILDALCPASDTFESALMNGKNLTEAAYLAAATCEFKAEETKFMVPLSWSNLDCQKSLMYADAGAHAATIWLRAVSEGFKLAYPGESFDKDVPAPKAGIFLWKFLTEEETNSLMQEATTQIVNSLLEAKIGTNDTLLLILLHDTLKFCRKLFEKKPGCEKKTSALMGTMYFTHRFFVSSRWTTPAEVYSYFRECILRHSVEIPPTSTEVFEPLEAKAIVEFFNESYLRNLPLIRLLHLPHFKLRLNLKEEKPTSTGTTDSMSDYLK